MTTSIPKPILPPVTREAHEAALECARREEREECAKIAARTVCAIPPRPHNPGERCGCDTANEIAAAIRARSAS